MRYNLLDEKWIPVLYRDGEWKRVGIRQALKESGRIRQVAASNPMDRVAILRFLLALLYWCKGNPLDDMDAKIEASFSSDWFAKLDEHKDCFNLLGEGKRFYQNGAYKRITAEHTANYLIHEVPSGTNKWHFRHSTDKINGLCPACCAMGLIRLPVFATSGGKGMTRDSGKSPGINSKPPCYILPMSTSLTETLQLSWHKVSQRMGTPEWETPNLQLPQKGDVPLLTGMTWLPRSVWLGDPEESESVCISCGRKQRVIQRCVFDGKGSSRSEERIWRDPHVLYVTTSKGEIISLHASDALGASDAAAGQWAKIMAQILAGRSSGKTRSLWIIGFSTVQNDKYLEAMEYLMTCPCSPEQVQESIERIERWQKEGSKLVRKIRPMNEKNLSRKHVEIPPMLAAIRPHVEERISAKASELCAGADKAWQRAAGEYRSMMDAIGKSLSPGFMTNAVRWRRQIAEIMPDMRPKAEPAKKASSKKGAGK